MFTRILTAIVALASVTSIAEAQTYDGDDRSPDVLLAIGIIGLVIFVGVIIAALVEGSKKAAPRPMTPEQLDQEAARLRALGRHAEAMADYKEKQTKMKLKEAELAEVEQFLASERAKTANVTKPAKK